MSASVEKRRTRADRTYDYIAANPGATFMQIHSATENPGGERVYASTSRALDRLVREGRIRRERDGRAVRSYPTQETM